MKEIMLKNKKLILMIFVLSILLIGSTYALLTINLFGEKTNSIIVGNLELTLNEDSCNGITVEKGIPVTNEEGMTQVACTFSVENTGNLDSVYSILIEDMELNSGEERVNDSDIKYGLVKNNSTAMIGLVSELDDNGERVLDSSILKVGNINTYELRFWLKYNASADSMNKTFLTNIKIVGENYNVTNGVISNITDYYQYEYLDELDYYGDGSFMMPINANHVSMTSEFKNAVLNNLSFTDSIGVIWSPGDPLPNPGNIYEDGGVTKNVESMAGMFLPYLSDGTYVDYSINYLDLSLWDTSNVTNMNGMFEESSATTLDLSSFDTSNVTDMVNMFCYSVAPVLDISGFDTSNVTDMSGMFYDSASTSFDLSNFDTSNVTNMWGMFSGSAATILDLSGFDTSNVTNMSDMFRYSEVTTLDLSGFDTSNVTDMSGMFASSAATTLDVSGFDTSNVTDISYMFASSAATTLDVSNFDTSKVTNMSGMFRYSEVTTLDLSGFDTSNVINMSEIFYDSVANPIYVKDQAMLDRFVADGSADGSRLQIK